MRGEGLVSIRYATHAAMIDAASNQRRGSLRAAALSSPSARRASSGLTSRTASNGNEPKSRATQVPTATPSRIASGAMKKGISVGRKLARTRGRAICTATPATAPNPAPTRPRTMIWMTKMLTALRALAPRQSNTATVSSLPVTYRWIELATPTEPSNSAPMPTKVKNALRFDSAVPTFSLRRFTVSARSRRSRRRGRSSSTSTSGSSSGSSKAICAVYPARLPS